jgi:hypothetical protein
MSQHMQESNSGVGRRVLNALTGWWRRLRGAQGSPDRGTRLSPLKPAGPSGSSAAAGGLQTRIRPQRPSRVHKKSGGSPKGSSRDGAELTLDQLCGYLGEDGFGYGLREDGTAIETGFRGRTGAFRLVIFIREEPALLGLLVRLPEIVPEPKRPAMAEAIARANYALALGCFELDVSDGEIDFRVSMPTPGGALTQEQFRSLLGAAMWTTDRYHRAFCRLNFADDLSPAEVVAEVEMADDPHEEDKKD